LKPEFSKFPGEFIVGEEVGIVLYPLSLV
jgi:hypothetical protein